MKNEKEKVQTEEFYDASASAYRFKASIPESPEFMGDTAFEAVQKVKKWGKAQVPPVQVVVK